MKNSNNKLGSILLFGTLLLTTVACDNASTSFDAPDTINDEVEEPGTVEETVEDATNPIRQDQLESDTRAREQREEWMGDPQDLAESDLESLVRNKLETNIPGSNIKWKKKC